MQAKTYEGYFEKGRFYVSGVAVRIPEQQRALITLLDEVQSVEDNADALATWREVKRMIVESAYENDLLTADVFCRDKGSRSILAFEGGEFAQ